MIICFCKSLTEKDIKKLIEDGAMSLDDIIRCCSACLDCGQCKEDVITLLERHKNVSSNAQQV